MHWGQGAGSEENQVRYLHGVLHGGVIATVSDHDPSIHPHKRCECCRHQRQAPQLPHQPPLVLQIVAHLIRSNFTSMKILFSIYTCSRAWLDHSMTHSEALMSDQCHFRHGQQACSLHACVSQQDLIDIGPHDGRTKSECGYSSNTYWDAAHV